LGSYLEQEEYPREEIHLRRERKIRDYHRQQELEAKIEKWRQRSDRWCIEEEEEEYREMILVHCKLQILEMWNVLDSISKEMELLKRRPLHHQTERMKSKPVEFGSNLVHSSIEPSSNTGLITLKNHEILYRHVFRPSHRLPTMTMDAYLSREQQRGNIIFPKTIK
jgi:hypothetical protein